MNNQLSKICISLVAVGVLLCSEFVFAESTILAAARTPNLLGTHTDIESQSDQSTSDKSTKQDSASKVHTTPIVLTLEKIEAVKTEEGKSGDQIYLNITEYSSMDKPNMHRIPEYPSHWLSKYIDKVKNVTVWNRAIKDTESVELVISLVESDAPPWDVDDLIGSVKLKIYIEKGKLEQEWSTPNKDIVKSDKEKGHFVLTGDGAEYKISLKLKKDDKATKDKPAKHASEKQKNTHKK